MPITPSDREYLKTNSQEKTAKEWFEFFEEKYTLKQIQSHCRYYKLPLRKLTKEEKSAIQSHNARKWHINENYFKNWSSNMAYILGFWFADGCIYGGKMFDITVHAKDKYILKRFAKELEYEAPIIDYVDRQAARINFSCVVIYNDLVKLGGEENKSLTLKFPYVPDEYISDFIRGYFDGDGCIYLGKEGRINSSFCCGNKAFLKTLLKVLKEKADITGGYFDDSSKTLRFGKADTQKLGSFMYQNNPELFLERKRQKFN